MTETVITAASTPTPEDLELINKYTRRPFSAEEVYVFSLTLCDNDVDRDFERFTVESLFKLEKMFVGKTGIIDHVNTSKNQTARIFSCEVQAVQGKKTVTGDDYFRLFAKAYIPVTEGNRETITAIDSGIKKEVSVGCAVSETLCSICSKPLGSCNHIKGQSFSGKLCYGELIDPYDAYEWSFVAVPAQREAGVTKSFRKLCERSNNNLEGIIKSLKDNKEITLAAEECRKLFSYIDELERCAEAGREYRRSLESEFKKLMAFAEPEVSAHTVKAAMSGLDTTQLKEFIKALGKKAEGVFPSKPQLASGKKERSASSHNKEFRI